MAAIKVKRSSTPGKAPVVGDLQLGELAINTYDGKLFLKKNNGTESVIELGAGSGGTSGSVYQNRYSYTATSNQTVFAATYTAPYVDVYQNGVKLGIGDYTATSGSSITLITGATTDDLIEIVAYTAYTDITSVQPLNANLTSISGLTGTSGFLKTNGSGTWTIDANSYITATSTETLTNKTISGAVLNSGYTEQIFAVTGTTPALSPTNGTIQTWTLSGNATPTAGTWAAGQSLTLMIDDGTAFAITWTSVPVTWVGGAAPTLATTGYSILELWKVGTTIYGALVGTA